MTKKRKVYAPFSLTSEAGVAQTPVEGYIDVNQAIYPTVSTGTVNENGKWTGVKSDDSEFIAFDRAVDLGDGGSSAFPSTNDFPSLNMEGFRNIFLALKPSNGGAYALEAIMGPDTVRFANLEPVRAGSSLRGNIDPRGSGIDGLFSDAAETLTADEWNIFYIGVDRLANQRNMQIRVTNNSGANSTVEVAFMRLI